MSEDPPKTMDPFFLCLSVGLGAGAGLGIAFDSLLIGLLSGAAFGVAIGMTWRARDEGRNDA